MDPNLAAKLKSAQDTMKAAGADHAEMRLQMAAQHVDELPFDALYRLIDPDRAIDELEQAQSRRARLLSLLRNLFALAPLLLTWGSLGLATIAYANYLNIHAHDQQITAQPFLKLWQDGFGGSTPLNFS